MINHLNVKIFLYKMEKTKSFKTTLNPKKYTYKQKRFLKNLRKSKLTAEQIKKEKAEKQKWYDLSFQKKISKILEKFNKFKKEKKRK